jgi:hypothetical protein
LNKFIFIPKFESDFSIPSPTGFRWERPGPGRGESSVGDAFDEKLNCSKQKQIALMVWRLDLQKSDVLICKGFFF